MKLKSRYWRIHTPLMMQMQTIECGAASLGIVLGYYGKYISFQELRYRCNISQNGSNSYDIIQAAAFYGLEGEGYQMDTEKLEELRSPAILFWDYTHFLVLEGFSEKMVYLNDPAYGPIAIPRTEFNDHYSGIALVFRVGETFSKSKTPPGLWQKLKEQWKGHLSAYLFFFLSGILILLPTLAVPLVFRIFIDHHNSNMLDWKFELLGILFFSMTFGIFFNAFQLSLLKTIASKFSILVSSRILWKLLRLPISFYQQRDPREICSRIDLSRQVSHVTLKEAIPAAIQLFLSLIYAALMFRYSILVASVSLFGAIFCIGIMYLLYRADRLPYAVANKEAEISEMAGLTGLENIEWIKAAGAESYFFTKWAGLYTRFINSTQLTGKKGTLLSVFPFFIQLLSSALLLGTGGQQVISGKLTLGKLGALQILLMLFLAPLRNFIQTYQDLIHIQKNISRIDDVDQAELDLSFQKTPSVAATSKLLGDLEFRNVAFGYYQFAPAFLENISFRVTQGKWLGITGLISSGKSTLGKLAASLIYPWQGEILYDGLNWNETLRNSVGWVSQDSFIFAGTIQENITLWNPSIKEEELFKVCEGVGLHEIVLRKPKKYDDWISEDGKNLTYSERQQLEIARALLRKPSILIIDEGLNAIEPALQRKILDFLSSLTCTCLFITYQNSILQECEEVLVMEKGKLKR
jgi:ABC-type bacteriocin/lantibiotic exporter with double-glycine peptidase domain